MKFFLVSFIFLQFSQINLAQNGQMLYDNCCAIRLIVALLFIFMSHIRPFPSPQREFGGLRPPKNEPSPQKLKYAHYKLAEICQCVQYRSINKETKSSILP